MKFPIFGITCILLLSFLTPAPSDAHRTKKLSPRNVPIQEVVKNTHGRADCDIILKVENVLADLHGLPRLTDRAELEEWERTGIVMRVPGKTPLWTIAPYPDGAKEELRLIAPLVLIFLNDIGKEYQEKPRWEPALRLGSLIRTEPHQKWLEKKGNSNAINSIPLCRSTHRTAFTVDISKRLMTSLDQRDFWKLLAPYIREGKIKVINERSCFHILVSPNYPEPFLKMPQLVAVELRTQMKKPPQ